jgi:hypothetical protein
MELSQENWVNTISMNGDRCQMSRGYIHSSSKSSWYFTERFQNCSVPEISHVRVAASLEGECVGIGRVPRHRLGPPDRGRFVGHLLRLARRDAPSSQTAGLRSMWRSLLPMNRPVCRPANSNRHIRVMTRRAGSADLPLHGGHVPRWLADRMTRLGAVMSEAIVHHYGRDGPWRRLAKCRRGHDLTSVSWTKLCERMSLERS